MYKKLSIVALICLSVLLTRCAGCKKQPAGKVPGSTYRQLQQRYGDSVARASTQFRSMTPKQQDFYKQGGRMHHLDTLLPSIRPGMLQDEVKLLLGEPSGTRTVGHKDYWNYMLFYSQALTLHFDEHRKLINLDGYGKAKWRNANFDHLVTQLKRGMMANDVNLILGTPDRVARSENGLTTTWFYEPQAGLATALEFEDEKLMSVTGHGQETWNRVNENDNQKRSGLRTS
jgi:outer membrane protein assembly factor BamE (lipoprotein component of BamABCDE complex)